MICTVDASVFVAASREQEQQFDASFECLQRARARGVTVVCPSLVLPECAAAVARATGMAEEADEILELIETFPRLQLIPVSLSLARQAAQIGKSHRLRGGDSVYVAVAEAFDATLLTWDTEMLERAPAVVPTMTPADWLARQPATP